MNTKKTDHLFLLMLIVFFACSKKEDAIPKKTEALTWEKLPEFPGVSRILATCFLIDNKLYAGLGRGPFINQSAFLNDFYELNLDTKVWTKKADFPGGARFATTHFSLNGKGFVAFGSGTNGSSVKYSDLWEFDPASNSWTKIMTYTGLAFPTQDASYSIIATVLDGKVYFVASNGIALFNPSDNSITKLVEELPERIFNITAFSLNGLIYLGTGDIPFSGFTELTTLFYEFNPKTKVFTKKTDFPGKARRYASSFSLNDKGYVLTGQIAVPVSPGVSSLVGTKDMWEYDPIANSWTASKDYTGLGTTFQVIAGNGEIAIVGTGSGANSAYANDFWMISKK